MTETSLAYLPVNACYKLSQLGKKTQDKFCFPFPDWLSGREVMTSVRWWLDPCQNDLTATSLEQWLVRGNDPNIALFILISE